MGFFAKLMGKPIPTKADPSVLAPYNIPPHDPINTYDECKAELHDAQSFEEAVSVIMAYVRPKVEEKGQAGDPHKAIVFLDREVPERRDEVQLVARYFGLHRGGETQHHAGAGGGGGYSG